MIGTFGTFIGKIWTGWGTMAVVFLIFALWQIGHEAFGPLVLPDPRESIAQLITLLHQDTGLDYILTTARRAMTGFAISSLIGISFGLLAGWSNTLSILSKPLVTVMLGMPPIAWIVLALLWFGGDGTPIFTVFISTVPMIFAGALQGVRMRDGTLDEMADSFRISWQQKLWHVQLPQIISYLFPAWATALSMSWKVVMTAELLASADGVGAGLAEARVNIDMVTTMSWITMVVALLLLIEGMLLNPLKDHVEGWKNDV